MTSLKYIELLAQDLTKLVTEDDDNYDVVMNVGQDDDTKSFKIHSSILSARTPYFKFAFSNRWKKTDGNKIILDKPNIRPKIFSVILRYIYGGVLELNELDAFDTLDLLVALDELDLNSIADDVQDYLLVHNLDWIDENFVYFHRIVFQHDSFKKLQNHWDSTVYREPNNLFFAEDFPDFEESSLTEILKLNELGIREVEIWRNIIRWGIAKYPSDNNTDDFPKSVSDWKDEHFNFLKETLKNLIPLVRLFAIPAHEFYQNVKPYSKLLEQDHYDEILQHHLTGKPPIDSLALPERDIPNTSPVRSNIISKQQAAIISSWIDKRERKLGFFASRISTAGAVNTFYEEGIESYMYKPSENPYCYSNVVDIKSDNNNNYYKSLTIYKCSNDKIIGEYKEIDTVKLSNAKTKYRPNLNSFIFSLENNSVENSIISRLKLTKMYKTINMTKFINYNNSNGKISLNPKNIFDIRHFDILISKNIKKFKVEKAETIQITRNVL